METKQRKELQKHFRKEVFEVLELISSKDEQLDYQEKAPIAYVSAELFNQWEDCYQIPRNQQWYKDAFSETEHQILKEFDETFEKVCDETPQNPPDIKEFIYTPEWKTLSGAAIKALEKLNENKSNN